MRDEAPDAAVGRLNRLVSMVLEMATDTLGFEAATVTARPEHQPPTTVAATDQRFAALDEAQYASGEGPCLAVLDRSDPVAWSDQDDEGRWAEFRQAAEDAGVVQSLSLHIPADEGVETAASLNLYARTRRDPSLERLRAAEGFATYLAAALQSIDDYRALARFATGLSEAMEMRAVIEQAKGMLMAERRISGEEAFTTLVAMSQNRNVKVREVAQQLVKDRSAIEGGRHSS
jgi:GAF domain-containing protein